MNPRELHSPVPMSDADYAAIRTRVHAQIAARRHRRNFAIGLATAAMIAFALWLQSPAPVVTHVEPRRAPSKAVALPPHSTPLVQPVAIAPAMPIAPHRKVIKPSEPLRIELHTHDPDIRIIWIVTPDKEES